MSSRSSILYSAAIAESVGVIAHAIIVSDDARPEDRTRAHATLDLLMDRSSRSVAWNERAEWTDVANQIVGLAGTRSATRPGTVERIIAVHASNAEPARSILTAWADAVYTLLGFPRGEELGLDDDDADVHTQALRFVASLVRRWTAPGPPVPPAAFTALYRHVESSHMPRFKRMGPTCERDSWEPHPLVPRQCALWWMRACATQARVHAHRDWETLLGRVLLPCARRMRARDDKPSRHVGNACVLVAELAATASLQEVERIAADLCAVVCATHRGRRRVARCALRERASVSREGNTHVGNSVRTLLRTMPSTVGLVTCVSGAVLTTNEIYAFIAGLFSQPTPDPMPACVMATATADGKDLIRLQMARWTRAT